MTMRFFRKWKTPLIVISALLGLLLVLPIIINNVDLNQFKPFIEGRVAEYTGRQLKIKGDLRFNFSLHPSLSVQRVTFENSPWSEQPNMFSIESLEVKIDLMSLIDKQLIFEELHLKGLALLVEKNSVGKANWLSGESEKIEQKETVTNAEKTPFKMPVSPVFRLVRFDEIRIQYIDVSKKIKTSIDIEVLDLSNHVINEPFTFNANGFINGRPFNVLGEAGIQSGSETKTEGEPLTVKFDANVLDSALTVTGEIKQPIIEGGIDIEISLTSKDINKSFGLVTGQSLDQYSVNVGQAIPLKLSAKFSNLGGNYELKDIDLKVADSDLKGKVLLELKSERYKLHANLVSKKINVDRILTKTDKRDVIDKEKSLGFPRIDLNFSWLNKVDADIRYDIDQILIDTLSVEHFLMSATLNKRRLNIERFDFNHGDALFRSQISIDGRKRKPVAKLATKIKAFDLLVLNKYIDITTLQQGRLNADINIKGVGENVKALIMDLSGNAQFQFERLQVSQIFNNKNHDIYIEKLGLNFTSMGSPVTFSLTGELDKEKIVMFGEVLTMASLLNNRATRLVVKAKAFEANISADMVSAEPALLELMQADLSLSVPSLDKSFDHIVKIFPEMKLDHSIPALPASINAQLRILRNSAVAKNIKILIGKNDLQGEAAIDASADKMHVSLDLSSDLLDIDSLFSSVSKQSVDSEKPSKTDKIFSTDSLPSFKFLNDFDADVRYRIKTLSANNESINNISLDMVVDAGELRVKPLKLNFAKGEISIDLELSDRDKLQFQLSSTIKNLEYDRWMALLTVDEFARGELDAEINLQGSGDSISELMAMLNGHVRVTTEGGSMNPGAMRLLSKDISSLIPFTDKSDRQKIRCAVAQFNVEDGLAKTHALVLDTGIVSALGSGEINLATEEIDLYVAPRTRRTTVMKLALVPLNVSGSLASPIITADFAGSTISTTKTAVNIGLAVATGGITLLTEDLTNKLWDEFIDDTDYCALALAGEQVAPARIRLKIDETETEIDVDKIDSEHIEALGDDVF
ncbi:MAG: hypothetical protein COA54_12885 [Thiotrichaceae bacterium]|nr:MAG: hypothetical protein COA54_12885 [Thiotrichaceae bacterium]